MALLLKNTVCVTLAPSSLGQTDVRIQDGMIVATGRRLAPLPGDVVHDLRGKLLLPGFVNSHTHLYSTLARGMAQPKKSPRNFLEILKQIWWKLDRALDDESIYYSALIGALEAARFGTTALIDHHASPKAISGSLDIIKQAMDDAGIRGVLCYETTDRGGIKERNAGIAENERFIRANARNPHYRGMVGAHASFTLNDESLHMCGALAAECNTGVHIHVAEDKHDVTDARTRYGTGVVNRLARHNILRSDSILAHCVHLGGSDFPKIHGAECWMAHNPRSNMNNRIGYAQPGRFGKRAALGTDGFPADMLAEAASGFFRQQDAGMLNQRADMVKLLHGGQQLISEIFSQRFGTIAKGSPADFVVMDYYNPTPMTEKNLGGHLLFGMNSSMVDSVMVGGKWIVKDRQAVGLDLPSIYQKAGKAAQRLWAKMEKL